MIEAIFGFIIGAIVAGVGATMIAQKEIAWLKARNSELHRLLETTKREFGEENCIELERRLKKAAEFSSKAFDTIERGISAFSELAAALGKVSYEKKKKGIKEGGWVLPLPSIREVEKITKTLGENVIAIEKNPGELSKAIRETVPKKIKEIKND